MIAPTAIFMDHGSRSGSVLLYNPNSEPAEVTISVMFGYPATDSAGNIYFRTADSVDASLPSAQAGCRHSATADGAARTADGAVARATAAGLRTGVLGAAGDLGGAGRSVGGVPDTGRSRSG
jgi:hypothetical protein